MRADRAAGGVIAAVGATVAVAALGLDTLASPGTLDAGVVPLIVAGVLVLAGLALATRPGEARLGPVLARLADRRALLFAALFLAYALTFRHVDYRVGTWTFTLAAMLVLGARRKLELVIVPLAVALLVYALFRHGFTVLLPTWL